MKQDTFFKAIFSLSIAALGFSLLFSGYHFDFWLQLSLTIIIITGLALLFRKHDIIRQLRIDRDEWPKTILLGLVSAIFLYLIFLIGSDLATFFLSFGKSGVGGIYGFGEGVDPRLIAFLLLFIIGPGEEVFWRGYLQKTFARRFGRIGVLITILAYAGVHLASGNMMLILAAFSGGVFWGMLYHYYKNLWVNIISHAFWDLIAFVLFPLS